VLFDVWNFEYAMFLVVVYFEWLFGCVGGDLCKVIVVYYWGIGYVMCVM